MRRYLFAAWLALAALLPQNVFAAAASAPIRVGYPQPSGAMLPLWVITEAQLDHKYGFNLQNIYISGGARLATTDGPIIDEAYQAYRGIFPKLPYMTEDQIASILTVADHPKAAGADPREFFDNRFLKELEDTGFVKELYRQS